MAEKKTDPGNRIPADYDFLERPLPRYPNGKWLINGEIHDMNNLEDPFSPEKLAAAQAITDEQMRRARGGPPVTYDMPAPLSKADAGGGAKPASGKQKQDG